VCTLSSQDINQCAPGLVDLKIAASPSSSCVPERDEMWPLKVRSAHQGRYRILVTFALVLLVKL
jgi:hypothetical protein